MVNFETFWIRFWEGQKTAASDKDKVHFGYTGALEWVQAVIIEKLKMVNMDDNVACIRNIQEAIRSELGASPEGCIRDGFRSICKECPKMLQCKKESITSS